MAQSHLGDPGNRSRSVGHAASGEECLPLLSPALTCRPGPAHSQPTREAPPSTLGQHRSLAARDSTSPLLPLPLKPPESSSFRISLRQCMPIAVDYSQQELIRCVPRPGLGKRLELQALPYRICPMNGSPETSVCAENGEEWVLQVGFGMGEVCSSTCQEIISPSMGLDI